MTHNNSTSYVGLSVIGDVDSLVFRDPTDTDMTPHKAAIITIMTISNVFMLLGNGFSIYIILRSRCLRRYTYYWLVLNLAVMDLMNSSIVVPLNIVWEFYGNWPFSQLLCDVEIFFDLGFSTLAAYSTVLLSLDKYLYITKPFFYHTYIGSKATLGSILAMWVIWTTYAAASVFGELARSTEEYKYDFPLDNCNFVLKHAYAIASFIVVFFIPLVILVFTSSRILCVARKHIMKIQDNHRVSNAAVSSFDLTVNRHTVGSTSPRPSVPVKSAEVQRRPGQNDTSAEVQRRPGRNDTPAEAQRKPEQNEISADALPREQKTVVNKNLLKVVMAPSPSASSPTGTDSEGCFSANSMNSHHRNKTGATQSTPNTFRAFGTVTLVIFAYIIMFAPYWIASVVNLGCVCVQPAIFEDYLAVFYYMHSLVNPFIYMATDRRYKKAIGHLMKKSKLCRICRRLRVRPEIRVSSLHH